jgi:type II secretory pathway component PulF
MPVYEYKGVSSSGRSVSGVLDGESLKAVKAKLKKDGIVVLEVQEGGAIQAARSREFSFGRGRINTGDVANATRQLATLLSSGLPLMEALNVLVDQEENQPLKRALASLRDSVREGSSFTDALKTNTKVFSQLYGNMHTRDNACSHC